MSVMTSFRTLRFLFFALTASALAQSGKVDPAFNPTVTGGGGFISAIAAQPDGKIVIGGSFSLVGNTARNNLARLHPDGSLDLTFDPGAGPNSPVLPGMEWVNIVRSKANALRNIRAINGLRG
jgi:Domain of unknown function (DUF5122) beta-propeller